MEKIRLQKFIADAGLMSRRAAEGEIERGNISVNGHVAGIGTKIDPASDVVTYKGKRIRYEKKKYTYIMLNKPRGYVTTLSDEADRKTVADLIQDVPERVYPVGRLDMHSEGLLLLTNDGQLAHSLMHPSHEVYKEYLVKLTPDEEGLPSPEKPLSGVIELDGERLLPAKCRLLTKTENGYIMTIAIRQGKNRQIRRMCAKCGYTVNSLKRVSEGEVKLGELPSGRWRYLTEAEVRYLKSL